MTAGELTIEALRLIAPVAVSLIALLRTRTELDILYCKHRELETGMPGQMRKRWYHVFKGTRTDKTSLEVTTVEKTTGKIGYDNIKKIAFLGLALGQSAMEAKSATTPIGKAFAFSSSLDEMAGMLTLDRDALEAEWADWGDDDKAKLMAECKDHFSLPDHELEVKIEDSIGLGLDLLDLIDRGIECWKGSPAS